MGISQTELEALLQLPEFESDLFAINQLGSSLNGTSLRMLMYNATKFGGGVAEIQDNLVTLLGRLGVSTDRQHINELFETEETQEFFPFTKEALHEPLQGMPVTSDRLEQGRPIYEGINRQAVAKINFAQYDIVLVEDPQVAPALQFAMESLGERRSEQLWIWRYHPAFTHDNPQVFDFLAPFISQYDAVMFTLAEYVPQQLKDSGVPIYISRPGINQFSVKNRPMEKDYAHSVLAARGVNIDPNRSSMGQISRFDHQKNPLGVIDAYRIAKKQVPGLQLLLMGAGASDDSGGERVRKEVEAYAGDDPDLHIYLNTDTEDTALATGAAQHYLDVIVQFSDVEGFGLTGTEGLWKGKPMVVSNALGLAAQVQDGLNGFVVPVGDSQALAAKVSYLIQNPDVAKRMGEAARNNIPTLTHVATDLINIVRRHLTSAHAFEEPPSNLQQAYLLT